jgi:hypothetical protein
MSLDKEYKKAQDKIFKEKKFQESANRSSRLPMVENIDGKLNVEFNKQHGKANKLEMYTTLESLIEDKHGEGRH